MRKLLLLSLPARTPHHPEKAADRGAFTGIARYRADARAEQRAAKQAARRLAPVILLHGLRRRRGYRGIGRIVAGLLDRPCVALPLVELQLLRVLPLGRVDEWLLSQCRAGRQKRDDGCGR